MVKKITAFFGILLVVLLSFGFTSAANGFDLNVKTNLPATVDPNTEYTVVANFNNTNTTYAFVDVSFEQNSVEWTSLPLNDTVNSDNNKDFTAKITIPADATGSYSKQLRAYYYNGPNKLSYVIATFSSTSSVDDPVLPNGCTDPAANNTNQTPVISTPSLCTYDIPTSDTFCELDSFGQEKGHLEITGVDITNNGQGDDEEWQYLDEIVIEVAVENNDNENIDDVMVELMIRNSDGDIITKKDMNLDDDEEDLGRIKDGEEEIATFTIDEVPIDLEDGNYKLYVRAYEENNEDNECVSKSEDFTNSEETYFEFSIESGDDSTVIVKNNIENVKASCGDENVEVSFMVYNIGSDDEDKVLVTLENSALGIYEKAIIDNLRDGKGKEVTFYIDVPETEKTYEKLKIYTYYNYDDDEDEDQESSYDDSSEAEGDDFEMYLEILSCKAPEPTLTASLTSEARVGENLIVKAIISNNGKDENFVISASGYESWANLVSVDPRTALIQENKQQEITIILAPTESGTQSFNLNTIVDGETYSQPVSVSIEEKQSMFGLGKINELTFYMIIAIIALLVLIFLVLIVKILRRSKNNAPDF